MALPLIITSCVRIIDEPTANKRENIALTRSQEEMVNENIKFAFSMFNKVNELETNEPNWIISPFSTSIALSMTANGTGGNSLTQIQNALGFSGFQINDINDYYNLLTKELLAVDNTTKLSIANSVWLHNDFKFHDSFAKTIKKKYDAEVTTLDLTKQPALTKINNWSAEKTNNLIPVILDELPENLMFCIMNSLYFKGSWTNEFKESSTIDDIFTCINGRQSQVKMMSQKESFLYCNNETFGLAEFPFGNEAFRMVVLLPNEDCTLEESLQQFTADYWTESMKMIGYDLDVRFPRFELKYETDLVGLMNSLGIIDIFDGNKADFTQLSSSDVFINLFKQSAYIKVDEKGAEAAATTMTGEYYGSSLHRREADFHMNRPFAFLIKEQSTGTILFMGKITEL